MNREIKFRMWRDGRMQQCHQLNSYENFRFDGAGEILMQFTGLKDKNGKEIYEGDIISNAPFNKHLMTDTWYNIIYKNRWDGDLITHHSICGGRSVEDVSRIDMNLFEVIGNVYENPELLKS